MAMVLNMRKILMMYFMLSASLLAGCTNNASAPVSNMWNNIATTQLKHTVQPGETLYSIAWRYNVSDEKLAEWNHLQKPYALKIGQVLLLSPPGNHASMSNSAVSTTPKNSAEPVTANLKFTPDTSTASSNKPSSKSTMAPTEMLDAATNTAETVPHGSWPWPLTGKQLAVYNQKGNKGIDISVPLNTPVKAVQPGVVVYAGSNLHGYGQLIIIKQKDDLMTAYAHNSKLLVTEGSKVTTGQTIALSGASEATQPMLHFEVRKSGKPVNPIQYLT